MSDLISRQAAIDAICKACSMTGDYHKCDGYPETSTWCDHLVALRALPSAQSEQNVYVVTYQDGDEEPVLSVFNNEVAAIAYRDEEGKNHDRIWLDKAPIFSKTLVDGRWFG